MKSEVVSTKYETPTANFREQNGWGKGVGIGIKGETEKSRKINKRG